MKKLHLGARPAQETMQPFHHGHRSVLAAGTAHGQGQGFTATGCILLHQKGEQGFDQGKKSRSGRIVQGMAGHPRIHAGMRLEVGIPVRIGKETDIPDQIGLGIAVFETKGKKSNAHNAPICRKNRRGGSKKASPIDAGEEIQPKHEKMIVQSAEQSMRIDSARSLMPRLSISWL